MGAPLCDPWAAPVRIRDAKPPQNCALGPFHCLGVIVPLVIVAVKVQETVDDKMGEMMGERFALGARLTRDGLAGKHDIAEVCRFAVNGFRGE